MTETSQRTPQTPTLDIIGSAGEWLKEDEAVALATVVHTWGSAPVPVGGQMLVGKDGKFLGSVSGGCVEAEVIAQAEDVLVSGAQKTLEFGIADETAWKVGLPCGGSIEVYLERFKSQSGQRDDLARILESRRQRRGVVIATMLRTGERVVVTDAEEPPAGEIGEHIRAAFANGQSRRLETVAGPLFVHALLPPPRLVIIGATHIGQVLAELAPLAGFDVDVIDPRETFASAARFPGRKIIVEWPGSALARLGMDRYTALVALAHVGNIDDEALEAALKSDSFYIGALGSRRSHEKRLARLKARGIGDETLRRIHGPIGLDIGAVTPPEIAISIVAELVSRRRAKRRKPATAA
jgi:xanthine dehydrogenase accessory factor